MLKRVSLFLAAVFVAAALASAATPAIQGTVEKVGKDSITVQVGGEQKTFTYDRTLKFTVNGKRPQTMTVKAGDKATIVANKNNVAEKVDIEPQASSGSGTGSSH